MIGNGERYGESWIVDEGERTRAVTSMMVEALTERGDDGTSVGAATSAMSLSLDVRVVGTGYD